MYVRMLWLWLRSTRWPRIRPTDVARTPFRVKLSDLDLLRHMNNGTYLSLCDLGRIDLMRRSGMWSALGRKGWYPVVVQQSISYRRSLELFQKFTLETRWAGLDEKGVYIEQRFTVDGQVTARAYVRARFLKRGGGTVSVAELLELFGVSEPPANEAMAWLPRWSQESALPASRAEAPSIW